MRFQLYNRIIGKVSALLAMMVFLLVDVSVARAADYATIFMYHRFGETEFPSTNIRMDQFEAHITELKNGGYNVLPVEEIVNKIRNGQSLPDKAIGITIDDAFTSIYEKAWPILKEAGFPFTIFVSTDHVDRSSNIYMSWDQLRELSNSGVTIGHHTQSHSHLPDLEKHQIRRQLERAATRFEAELGIKPKLFAYPYGDVNLLAKREVAAFGFDGAFGQQSGVLHGGDDFLLLPRFALNETYGGIDRFRLAANALPLPVSDIVPADTTLGPNPPAFGFTVPYDLKPLDRLACFASGQGKSRIERLENRIEVRLTDPFPPGHARINCTLPGPPAKAGGSIRWRWFGRQFYIPE